MNTTQVKIPIAVGAVVAVGLLGCAAYLFEISPFDKQVVRRLDPHPRGRSAVALVARPQPSAPVHQEVLHQDLPEHLGLRRKGAAGEACVEALEQLAGVGAHLLEPGNGVAGLGAQSHRSPVAFGPLGAHQLIQYVRRMAGHDLQGGADRLG
ncbi:hypothetical protein [Streptomyces olindensis]|uniref:hypothetical protein n=1 Tax=Streptomyces olindensis TaxID=358823 RepID=UPI0036580DF7